jgi:hypothetical protein
MENASASRLQMHQQYFDNVKVRMHFSAPKFLVDVAGALETRSSRTGIAITNTQVIERTLINNIRRFLELDLRIGQIVAFIMTDLSVGQS